MAVTLDDIKSSVRTLTLSERSELLEFLESTTLATRDEIRGEWSELAKVRLAEHDAGLRRAVPFDSVFSRVSVE